MILLELFRAFFKIGAFAFGGGYAVISLLRAEAIDHNWATASEFANFVAVSQITPGPIAVNMATFVGFRVSGFLGALVATAAVVLPSFVLILIIMRVLKGFRSNKIVDGVFYGLRPATLGMIGSAAVLIAAPELLHDTTIQWPSVAIFVLTLFLVLRFKVNMIYLLLGAAAVGIVVFGIL